MVSEGSTKALNLGFDLASKVPVVRNYVNKEFLSGFLPTVVPK